MKASMKQYKTIREKLEAKQKELENRLKGIKKRPGRLDQAVNSDFQEQAVERQSDEVADYLDKKIHAELHRFNQALSRMDRGEYGKCERCGKKISIKRLEALPYTERCISCAG